MSAIGLRDVLEAHTFTRAKNAGCRRSGQGKQTWEGHDFNRADERFIFVIPRSWSDEESAFLNFPVTPEGRNSQGGPMEFKLKTISAEGIEAALSKVELYRFLNEPEEAESICQDVLAVEPGHQLALRFLGLAITDQFTGSTSDRYAEVENAFQ